MTYTPVRMGAVPVPVAQCCAAAAQGGPGTRAACVICYNLATIQLQCCVWRIIVTTS